MKDTRRTFSRLLVALVLASACLATVARSQNREEHFISARAGGINFVSGDVSVLRAGDKYPQRLSVKDNLRSGDIVRASGRVEMLLNPGSYMRAGDGAELELTNASLDDLRLKLIRGGAVIEVTGYDGMELSILITTPQTRVRIVRSGLYRLNVLPSGMTEVAVQSGRAYVGSLETRIKGGKVARVSEGGAIELAKFDKKMRDALDLWSRERGHELAKVNEKLANKSTNALLARTSFDSYFSTASGFGPSGLWLWSSQYSCYTFLPFSFGYRSPYGFWYGSSFNPRLYPCQNCGPYDFRPRNDGNTPSPTVIYRSGGDTGGTTPGGTNTSGGSPAPAPPPQMSPPPPRIERPVRERSIEPGYNPPNR